MKNFLFALLFPVSLFAQHQERKVFLYNIGLGGLTGGIGALLNKPKGGSTKNFFLKGFWQGSTGGLINYSSKKTLYLVTRHQQNAYALPATLLHSMASSIMENAALNEPFLQNWKVSYGPVRFDFSINNRKKFKVRLLPESIYAVFWTSRLGKFDAATSLLTGVFVYENENYFIELNGKYLLGNSLGRAFAYVSDANNDKHRIIAHEMLHVFQYSEYQVFNTWLKPLEHRVHSKTLQTIFSKYIYFDFPHFFGLYELEGRHNYPYYYKNFFELEAERFATNRYVPTH